MRHRNFLARLTDRLTDVPWSNVAYAAFTIGAVLASILLVGMWIAFGMTDWSGFDD